MARGIEPVIAAVILIAIAVVVAIAVIGWIMGLWGAVTTPREQLSVTGVGLNATSKELTLIVTNSGGTKATITHVSINGPGCVATGIPDKTTIDPGASETVTVTFTTGCSPTVGAMYSVTVYTEAGGAYPTVVKAV
ncbi:MAG: archaellin/type IV pilin N-terminal domain-containing protein [Desulfurococcaceae archaeon]